MQALLLATGESLKLRPLTERIPSPLVPVMNRPIMIYNLELLGRLCFKHVLVSVQYLAGSIERYFGDGQKWGLSLEYVLQRDALGSAGALRWIKGLLQETFIVLPADVVADLEIAQAIRQHTIKQAAATVVVQPGSSQSSRALWVKAGGHIGGIGSGPPGMPAWIDTGIYLFDPLVLDRIPARLPFEIHQQLLPILIAEGIPVQACALSGYWNPLDTFQSYMEAQHVFLSKAFNEKPASEEKISYRYHSVDSQQIYQGVWAGRNVKIHPSAKITPMVSIGGNSWIGREAELGPGAVIGSSVVIDQGATIQHSIILDHTYVGKLVHLENRLVNQDQLVDLCTNGNIRVVDPILLGKADPQVVIAGFKRSVDFFLVILFLLISLPLALSLAILLLLTTGRVFKRVPCHSPRAFCQNGFPTRGESFDLLHFNTRKADGRSHWLGSWVESWEGQRLPELWNVLKGDLALIGLKPVVTEAESGLRASWQLEQDRAPAGFTGLWYVQTTGISPLEENLVADAYYLVTRSWAQDWRILRRTPAAWVRRARSKLNS